MDLQRAQKAEAEVTRLSTRIAELEERVVGLLGELARVDDLLLLATKAERDRIAGLEEQVEEYDRLFELQRARMGEADAAWRAAHPGSELVLPDLGDLLTWLLEQRAPT